MTDTFDLIVIGAGSGGIATAVRAARSGARVALVESGPIGGTCVNVGCVPKKAMWLAAESAEAQRLARDLGFPVTPAALDWDVFLAHRTRYIDHIHASYRRRLGELTIEFVEACAHFVAPHRVAVGAREIEAPHIVIATGGRPQWPSVEGRDFGIDSDGFFKLRRCPTRVAVIGSGYIAVELAGVLEALGAEVHLILRGKTLLARFDAELGSELATAMRARGIELHGERGIQRLEQCGGLSKICFGNGAELDGFDCVIWAIGRVPNVEDMGLDGAGVALDARGFIAVDEYQNTNVGGIYAVGDVCGRVALTPVAIAAGRRLADRLFAGQTDAKLDYDNIASVVFSHPPLGTVGLSEEAARAKFGDAVKVYRSRFVPMSNALAERQEKSLVKLVCVGPDERVAGVHLFGPAADEILQGFAVAVRMGARKADFDATVAIHPTLAEELVLLS